MLDWTSVLVFTGGMIAIVVSVILAALWMVLRQHNLSASRNDRALADATGKLILMAGGRSADRHASLERERLGNERERIRTAGKIVGNDPDIEYAHVAQALGTTDD